MERLEYTTTNTVEGRGRGCSEEHSFNSRTSPLATWTMKNKTRTTRSSRGCSDAQHALARREPLLLPFNGQLELECDCDGLGHEGRASRRLVTIRRNKTTTHVGVFSHAALFEDTPTFSLAVTHTCTRTLQPQSTTPSERFEQRYSDSGVAHEAHARADQPTPATTADAAVRPPSNAATRRRANSRQVQCQVRTQQARRRRAPSNAQHAAQATMQRARRPNTLQIPRVSSKGDVFPRGGKCEAFSRTLVLNNTPPWIRTVKIEFPLVSVPYIFFFFFFFAMRTEHTDCAL